MNNSCSNRCCSGESSGSALRPAIARHCVGDRPVVFEDAAEVVGPREAAEAGDDIQRVLPVEQQTHGGFYADAGEVPPRRDAQRRRKGPDEVALGDAQPLAQLFHAVEPGVVFADVLDGGGHQRGRAGAALSASESSHSSAKAS